MAETVTAESRAGRHKGRETPVQQDIQQGQKAMILKNSRHELFAQAIASGKTPAVAFSMAGFLPNSGNASRLLARDTVRQRVNEIQSAMAARTVKQVNYTREWVIEQLVDNVEQAKAKADFGAANVALKLLGTERHMFVDRKETGQPGEFANLATAEDVLALVAQELGPETAALLTAALAKADEPEPDTPAIEPRGPSDTLN